MTEIPILAMIFNRPWSIASRVRELKGEMEVLHDSRPGAHLRISIPQTDTTT